MELDEFLEKDILHFLEERKEKKAGSSVSDREEDYGLYLTKDYVKEVSRALEKDEITEAQKLFDELKTHYDTLPKASLEAKKIYSILEQLYSKITAYNQLKGNAQQIKTFDDALGKGFQGSIPQKIHQTTTKIDKKIDTIDLKLTTFGKDVKDLRNTILDKNILDKNILDKNILDKNISSSAASDEKTIYLKGPKLDILPPEAPKDSMVMIIEHKSVEKPSAKPTPEKKQKTENTKIESTHFETKQKIEPKHIEVKQKIHEEANIPIPMTIQDVDKHAYPNMQSPIVKREGDKKRIHLYKIPKDDAKKKRHKQNIGEALSTVTNEDKDAKDTQYARKNNANRNDLSLGNDVATTKSDNIIMPVVTMPDAPEKKVLQDDANSEIDKFDSPFQTVKPFVPEEKKLSIQDSLMDKKTLSKKDSDGSDEYSKIYSDALREMHLKNYEGASRLFMKVLELKPTHKASIIRLKQCEEAMHNA